MKQLILCMLLLILVGCQTTGGVRANGNGEDVNTNVRGGVSISF